MCHFGTLPHHHLKKDFPRHCYLILPTSLLDHELSGLDCVCMCACVHYVHMCVGVCQYYSNIATEGVLRQWVCSTWLPHPPCYLKQLMNNNYRDSIATNRKMERE